MEPLWFITMLGVYGKALHPLVFLVQCLGILNIMMMFVPQSIYCFIWQQKNEVMQKQLEALSFLDKRKATKPKVVADQAPSVSGAPLSSDQVIVPVQQQTSGYMVSS